MTIGVRLVKFPPTREDPFGYNKALMEILFSETGPDEMIVEPKRALFFTGVIDGEPFVTQIKETEDQLNALRTAVFQDAKGALTHL